MVITMSEQEAVTVQPTWGKENVVLWEILFAASATDIKGSHLLCPPITRPMEDLSSLVVSARLYSISCTVLFMAWGLRSSSVSTTDLAALKARVPHILITVNRASVGLETAMKVLPNAEMATTSSGTSMAAVTCGPFR